MKEHNDAWVACRAIVDEPEPPVPSTVAACELCGCEVWLSDGMLDELSALHPGSLIRLVCNRCPHPGLDDGDGRLQILPGQLDMLRSMGMSLPEVALALAVCEVGKVHSPDDPKAVALLEEVRRFPRGEKAKLLGSTTVRVLAELVTTTTAIN